MLFGLKSDTRSSIMFLKITPLLLILSHSVFAAEKENSVESLFDFWVGDWELTWTAANGKVGKGANKIDRILDGKVIEEKFEAANGYKGRSLSVYDVQNKEWKQTWTDNRNGYLTFVGESDGDNRIFKTKKTVKNGKEVIQRMVFHSIEKDSFTWEWMQSEDGGESWKTSWRISYVRKG